MKTTTTRNLEIFFAFVLAGVAPMLVLAEPKEQDPEQLAVVMNFESVSNSYYITLKNNSDEFLCLSTEQFDTGKGAITLHDAAGKLVPLRSYREPAPPLISLKFNFAEPYFFMQPQEVRKVYIDAGNFIANASVYSYEVIFSYYRCRDIIDLARIRAKKDIQGRSLHTRGSIDMGLRQK